MTQPKSLRTHSLINLDSQKASQHALLQDSSGLMKPQGAWGFVKQSLLCSREEREQRERLSRELLTESEREQTALLAHVADAAQLAIDVMYQVQRDELRIEHRQAMEELSKVSERRLRSSINTLFVTKKSELEKLEAISGDQELIVQAAEYLDMLATTSAQELIQRNTKPR